MTLTASPATSVAVNQAAFADLATGVTESWITTTDHRKIGRLFVGASLLLGVVGAALNGLVQHRLDGFLRGVTGDYLGTEPSAGFSFLRVLAGSGTGLIFLVVIPLFILPTSGRPEWRFPDCRHWRFGDTSLLPI
jgi:hypothetical protein